MDDLTLREWHEAIERAAIDDDLGFGWPNQHPEDHYADGEGSVCCWVIVALRDAVAEIERLRALIRAPDA